MAVGGSAPRQKAAASVSHAKVAVEDDTIHAVVRANQQLVDVAGEFVRYGHGRQATGYVRLLSPVKEVKNPASHFLPAVFLPASLQK
jgi:hypothetical protein